jgi:hypothetical protein
LGRR